jgi:hypothetical protein
MIVCALKDQLELFISLPTFGVDISYKRLKKGGLNEVLFTAWLPQQGKSKLSVLQLLGNNY